MVCTYTPLQVGNYICLRISSFYFQIKRLNMWGYLNHLEIVKFFPLLLFFNFFSLYISFYNLEYVSVCVHLIFSLLFSRWLISTFLSTRYNKLFSKFLIYTCFSDAKRAIINVNVSYLGVGRKGFVGWIAFIFELYMSLFVQG